MLYLVEFANWNSQDKIGYGCGNNSSTQAVGASDAMPYHTGTMQTSRTTYGVGVQYRNIEGLWDNVFDWMDGCYYNTNGLNVILNPSNFSDSANGTLVGKPAASGNTSAFAIPTVSGLEWALYPSATGGSNSTYVSDYWRFNASNPSLICGGNYNHDLNHGLFFGYAYSAAGSDAVGCRLQKLP